MRLSSFSCLMRFQSTRPARGATNKADKRKQETDKFQSTRPARGATFARMSNSAMMVVFQSTRPARGATEKLNSFTGHRFISIHAPREGRDRYSMSRKVVTKYFNPRAPRGARPNEFGVDSDTLTFQSTRPARGATAKVNKFLCTFLQKRHGFQISLRKTLPFKAFCRLQIGKNFSICGANRYGNFCELLLRTIRSSVLPEGRSACSQNAQFYSHTFSRDNRNADCLFPDP